MSSSNRIATTERSSHANLVLGSLSVAYFLFLWSLSFFGRYGYFIDEFYYVACSNHLALGYVDHPPLSIFILKALRTIIGDSLPALRLLPALCGAGTAFITGLIARRLGAGSYGQALAAGATMVASIFEIMFSIYSMNCIALLLWAVTFLILVEIERRDEPRLWLAFGVVAGLAFENKHTFVLLLLGLGVGMLATRARRHFTDRRLWAGAGIAAVLFAPNIMWQINNGWPSLEFYRNADLYKNVPTPPFEVLKQQVLYMNPGSMLVWLAGLVFYFGTERGRRYRHLGWIYLALLAIMLIGQKSRPDRISAAYIALFAAGGAAWSVVAQRAGWRWLRFALPAVLVVHGMVMAPLALPILPPETAASYGARLGIVPQIEKGEGKKAALPQWLADRLGWEQLVDDVTYVVSKLTPEERRKAVIVAPSYGQAGALELLGRGRNLPPVYGLQNSYYHWGPPPDSTEIAIIVGPFGEEAAHAIFEDAEVAAIHDCEWCMPWRDEIRIWVGRRPKISIHELWPRMKHYE